MTTLIAAFVACSTPPEAPPPAPAPVADPAPARVDRPKAKRPRARRPDAAKGQACPEGTVRSARWPGEYPDPIVEVTAPVTIRARPDPCERPSLECEVEPGLYHPWATPEQDHDAEYAVIRAVERFEATGEVTIGSQRVSKGTIVEVHNDLGEGFCQWWLGGEDLVEDHCPQLLAARADLKPLEPVDFAQRQLARVPCRGGEPAWIDVGDELLARPEVREGRMIEFGKVGPAK